MIKFLQGPFQIVKASIVHFSPKAPKEANRRHFSHHNTPWPSRGPPTSKQVDISFGHNPGYPETTEERTPQSRSHVLGKKKMIHRLTSLLTHVASVYYDNMPLPEIIQDKNLVKSP
jgi:hypothetical protein